jgi:hypothetical protein
MIRDRRTLISVLAANVFVMAGALFVLRDRYVLMKTRAEAPTPAPAEQTRPPAPETPTGRAPDNGYRNILFSYRDSRPARVEIIGSFNDWEPQRMTKGANHTWTLGVRLKPGDHTYNFLVDGKAIRDPNNPRTAPEGRSLLTVKPLND